MNRFPDSPPQYGVATAVLWSLFCVSCATTNPPPLSSVDPSVRPPRDEERLWDESRLEERTLLQHVNLYQDDDFYDYTRSIIERLVAAGPILPTSPIDNYEVYLIESGELNAFSYPHGSIYINTGLLSRIGSEDQLAALIAHEMHHIDRRHSLRLLRQEKNQRRRWLTFGIVTTAALIALDIDAIHDEDWVRHDIFATLTDGFLALGFEGYALAAQASVEGFGQRMEWEADEGAFVRLAAAGYDTVEAASVFDLLIDGLDENANETRTFLYSNPAELAARRGHLQAWIAANP
ncbi:MAG: M48 family metalloprotease [Thermoanaerobaculia bacterium]|nr:M48 family metalloprotease [Thermoanaerobaculia bacterium]